MAIILYLTNINREIIKEIGSIEDNDLIELTDIAKDKNLRCLSLIDFVGDTILNQKQVKELKKEIEILQNEPQINKKILQIIVIAIEEALKAPQLYFMFNGE